MRKMCRNVSHSACIMRPKVGVLQFGNDDDTDKGHRDKKRRNPEKDDKITIIIRMCGERGAEKIRADR
jgi:hypothetical protein